MTTPSETRAWKLPELPECWSGSPVTVTWAEDGETTTREVYTADQMHAYAREALAASEPVEAGCYCDGKMTDGRHWLSCPLSRATAPFAAVSVDDAMVDRFWTAYIDDGKGGGLVNYRDVQRLLTAALEGSDKP